MTNKVRASVVFPRDLWKEVTRQIPSGERSSVIAEAMRRELRLRQRSESVQRLGTLQADLRTKYGEMPPIAEDIRNWCGARLTGLR